MKRWLARLVTLSLAVLTPVAFLQTAPSAQALTSALVQVTNFGSNPSGLQMYAYVPTTAKANPPILLALHQCTGSGPGFFSGTAFASLADQYGFIVIYPSVTRSGSCWDVSSSQALTRNGGSDPVGLMSMITYAEQHYGGNPNAVYVTGASSGAMMTNVMLGDYPDVFKAGAAFMGVPFGCFFTGTVDGWNTACADGQVSNTAAAWGNMVRNADPGYAGPRPRMQLWHGTADGTLNYENLSQEILQWTNVLGVSSTPTSTTMPVSGWTETQYDNAAGTPQVEAFSIAGAGHVLPESGAGMEANAIAFMGLNTTTTQGGGGQGGGSCHVSYQTTSQWTGGFTGSVTITDTGSAALSGWTLKFTFPGDQHITSAWNGTATQSGENVTITNASYNGTVAAGGGSTSAGFQGTWTSSDATPASFTLNGATCT
jgi:poly(hydroxyalkanoate) depolymerase family esterase